MPLNQFKLLASRNLEPVAQHRAQPYHSFLQPWPIALTTCDIHRLPDVRPMNAWLTGSWAVFQKDLHLELRSRYAINMLLMFVLSVIALMLIAVGREPLTINIETALLWIVVLFAAALGLGRSFVSEEDRGTMLLLRLNVPSGRVYTGKLLFNFFLMLVVEAVALLAFVVLLSLRIVDVSLFLALLVLGALGLAGATTLLAAIIARAANRGPLLPVLAFPLLIPLLLSVINVSISAMEGGGWAQARGDILTLVGYTGAVISASVVLFDHVWQD
jgi:heme exporter protein B